MTSPRPRKGQRVMIYQDPLTREQEEGLAILVKCEIHVHPDEPDEPELWHVRFDAEPDRTYQRWV